VKGLGQLLGFLFLVLPAVLWQAVFGVRCPKCRGLGDLSRGGDYDRCPRCKGRGVLL